MKKIKTGKAWIAQAFKAQAVAKKIVIRRKKTSVAKYASYEMLERHCKAKKFHLIETGGQYIVICNDGDFKLHF